MQTKLKYTSNREFLSVLLRDKTKVKLIEHYAMLISRFSANRPRGKYKRGSEEAQDIIPVRGIINANIWKLEEGSKPSTNNH